MLRKPKDGSLRPLRLAESFRCQFLGLALMTHQLERALGLFVSGRDLLLHLGGGLFHFWREAHVAVVLHAGTGSDEASNNDVLFQSSQVINLTLNGGFGENARCHRSRSEEHTSELQS